jgi:hypothetical protein
MDVVFRDCVFRDNSHPTVIDRHSSSADDVAVGFWRCIFDSGVIAAGVEIAVVSESCEFDRSGDLSLDPRYCSPFVTFAATGDEAESGNVVVFVAAGAGVLVLIVVVIVVIVVCRKGKGQEGNDLLGGLDDDGGKAGRGGGDSDEGSDNAAQGKAGSL